MVIVEHLNEITDRQSPFVITIGNFDGVHKGHQELIKQLKSSKGDLKTLVITFDPHPVEFFDTTKSFKKLFSSAYQNDQLQVQGVDYLLRLKFDGKTANLTYSEFLDLIKRHLNLRKVVIGHDLKIGKNRQGNKASIADWCTKAGIEFHSVEPFVIDNQIVSSTHIKYLIEQNRFEDVLKFLGRPYSISGTVIHGDKRGRLIGFPTANMICQKNLYLPNFGVYQTSTKWKEKYFDSITNVGKTPTFKSDDLVKVETHIFDFKEEIYGDQINIEFIKFIRPEKKFSGIDDIKKQITLDIQSLSRKTIQ